MAHVNNTSNGIIVAYKSDIVDRPEVSPPTHCASMKHQGMLLLEEFHKQTVKISRAGILHEPGVALLPASCRTSLHTVHVTYFMRSACQSNDLFLCLPVALPIPQAY